MPPKDIFLLIAYDLPLIINVFNFYELRGKVTGKNMDSESLFESHCVMWFRKINLSVPQYPQM